MTREEVVAAASRARVDEIAYRLPGGWDARVGEGGTNLSGGERQRVSIARALLKDAPIVLLDEATSALDVGNEIAIGEAIDRIRADRTLIIIAHRLQTIMTAEKIIMLAGDGSISETGTHTELLAAHGSYARYWTERVDATGWQLTPTDATPIPDSDGRSPTMPATTPKPPTSMPAGGATRPSLSVRFSARDLVSAAIFAVIYFVIVFAIAMLGIISPLVMLLTLPLSAIAAGIPYMLFLTRARHPGMTTLFGIVLGLLDLMIGHPLAGGLAGHDCGVRARRPDPVGRQIPLHVGGDLDLHCLFLLVDWPVDPLLRQPRRVPPIRSHVGHGRWLPCGLRADRLRPGRPRR